MFWKAVVALIWRYVLGEQSREQREEDGRGDRQFACLMLEVDTNSRR